MANIPFKIQYSNCTKTTGISGRLGNIEIVC